MTAQHRQPAQQARVSGLTHVRVAELRMTVLEAEGTVQLVVAREGDTGSFTTFFNEFCDSETAGQLRQLADAVAAAWAAAEGQGI
ncbi:hypothetical protein [Cereibacter sphaeroides]|jgi:hypothetical protein|uniref:hypothetical protein n=1 Tax=Cereibacter sphaeroides TaxID=1063 RepID=UPI00006653A8|nr:hypothetical protein Rsph17029_3295 [Cereibacter sphaeroides ATCC 17029]